ncbi:MAG: EAL domain-containing protein [Lautropia sp.]
MPIDTALAVTPAHVLVVDDDPFLLRVCRHVLGSLGCARVSTALSGAQALTLLRADGCDVDLMLCDLEMPEMDGVALLHELAERRFGGAVALFSAQDPKLVELAEALARAQRLRVIGRLGKPVRNGDAVQLLERWRASPPHPPAPVLAAAQADAEIQPATLSRAIATGELRPVFQPQVDIGSGRVVGAEALARWTSPVYGVVSPARFIDAAESHGLIQSLTRYMLEAAVGQAARWHAEGFPLSVSVNISTMDLADPGFPERVAAIVRRADLPPASLTLEVTETRMLHELTAAREVLLRLRLQRFGLAIDDFGTGYASLAHLHALPFTELKIDRSFVIGAATQPSTRAILASSVALGRELGLTIVGEGVETIAEWEALTSAGCHRAQGYLVSRPIEASRLTAFARTWRVGALGAAGTATPAAATPDPVALAADPTAR